MTNAQAVGRIYHRPQSWAIDFIAVLVMSTFLAVVGAKIGMLDRTKEKLAQAGGRARLRARRASEG
jgi:hypothetical protein